MKTKKAVRQNDRLVVAMVTDAVYPFHRGGKETRYYELAQRLTQRAELHIYTMRWWTGDRVHTDHSVTFHAISRLRPLYSRNRRSMIQAMLFAMACLRMFRASFDALEADQIPILQILVLRVIATIKRKRLVVTWHEVWGSSYWRQYLGPFGIVAALVESLTMRLPDQIIATSPETADRLRAVLGSCASITIAPNGIDLDDADEAYPHASTTDLVVVGRLIDHKRIDMLLDAMALLHSDGVFVTCRVIGDGPERASLRERAQALRLTDAVDFCHDVSEQKDVYSYIKAAKIFVLPSAREGFGIAALEALACGVQVVTTSAPDNLAQHFVARSARGVVCDPSASAIADSVKRLLADSPIISGGRGRDADAWLVEYSWDAVAEKVAQALTP